MSKKRQIVFLMTDTTRYDMLGCYGNPDMKTPNLDALAQGGVRYERAYTCQPVCGPARSALFTGTYPHSCGGWTNSVSLYDNVKTIGQRLRDNGVPAAYIGKWHMDGSDYFGNGFCPDGWDKDYWYDMRTYLMELTEEERYKSRQSKIMQEEDISEDFTYGHRCSNRAIDYLKKHGEDDFFLVVSYDEPHGPSLCPPPFSKMYRDYEFPKYPNVYDTLEGKPEYQKVWAGDAVHQDRDKVNMKFANRLGCNSFADYEMGRVIEQVRKSAPDALIIYTSDHGEALQSHCIFSKGPAVYDEIARIPLIINGGSGKGEVYKHPVSHIDLAPTILEYMNIPIPKILEGRSILKTANGYQEKVNERIFIEFGRYEIDHDNFGGFQPLRAVFDGRYKLSINLLGGDEMYDLKDDPYEMINIIHDAATAKKRDELHDALLDWMNNTRDPFRGYYWECRPWRKDARTPTWNYTNYTRQRENEEYEPRQLDYNTGLPMTSAVRKKGE